MRQAFRASTFRVGCGSRGLGVHAVCPCGLVVGSTEGVLVGLAICEDSEAISQGIDDFLEGTALFGWAKSFLHRQGGFRFGVRAIGTLVGQRSSWLPFRGRP